MFYIFYGGDSQKARAKANELMQALRQKKPEAGVFRFESNNFTSDDLEHLVAAQGLFENNYIVMLDNVLELQENRDLLKEYTSQMSDSPHMFILLEREIDKNILKSLEKAADKVQHFGSSDTDSQKAKNEFNIFELADALGERSNKKLWISYERAREYDTPAEEMFGILFWQIKSILLASAASTPDEAGMSAFPFKKAKGYLQNFNNEELINISSTLVHRYHQSRTESREPEIELERFVLGE